jgi:hypothetical protein
MRDEEDKEEEEKAEGGGQCSTVVRGAIATAVK